MEGRERNRFGLPIKSSKEKEQRQYQETGERNQARATDPPRNELH
ncbi:hypothetical protein [Alkalicoccobacillus plakortidis]|nr:hypothetical protein [Alkalicoccobacillus plakortidis]